MADELSDDELRKRYNVRRKTPAERAANTQPQPRAADDSAGAAVGAPSRSIALPRPSPSQAIGTPTRSVVSALLGAIVIFAIAGGQLTKRVVSHA